LKPSSKASVSSTGSVIPFELFNDVFGILRISSAARRIKSIACVTSRCKIFVLRLNKTFEKEIKKSKKFTNL
jgi:hypothetical protein